MLIPSEENAGMLNGARVNDKYLRMLGVRSDEMYVIWKARVELIIP